MKKDRLIRILLLAAAALVILALPVLYLRPAGPVSPQTTAAPTRPPTVPTTVHRTTLPTEPEETTLPETTAATEPEATETGPTEPPATEPEETWPRLPDPPAETEPERLSFPWGIPGTELVITQVSSYDGVFLEGGRDVPVTGVCAIVLMNAGSRELEYAEITLIQGDRPLHFQVSGLTSGSSALVLEYDGAAWEEGDYLDCSASVSMVDAFERSEALVEVAEGADGTLTVTNISGRDIPCVRVFYKFYMSDMDVYLGGITYTAKLVDLAAGASQHIQPSHYLAGMSRIVMVKTYDTAQ